MYVEWFYLLCMVLCAVDQLWLRAAVDSPSSPLHFAVHIRTPEGAQVRVALLVYVCVSFGMPPPFLQISIFEMSHADDQLYLHTVHSYTSPEVRIHYCQVMNILYFNLAFRTVCWWTLA